MNIKIHWATPDLSQIGLKLYEAICTIWMQRIHNNHDMLDVLFW